MAPPRKWYSAEERRAFRRAKQAAYATNNYKGQSHGHIQRAPEPSPEALIEREIALSAPRTIGEELCGVPLFGRSALDRRRAHLAEG